MSGAVRRALAPARRPRPARRRWSCRTRVAKVSLLRFEKVPPRADDLESWFAGRCARACRSRSMRRRCRSCPGARGGRRAASSSSRWRGATSCGEYEAVCQAAGLHAGVVDLATFNLVNAVLAAGGPSAGDCAAGARGARLPDRGDPARRAADVLSAPRVGRRGQPRRRRAPDRDVLRGSPAAAAASRARFWRAPDARRRGRAGARGARHRRGAAPAGGAARHARRDDRPAPGGRPGRSHRRQRRRCSTRWPRSSAFSCASGRPDAAHQPLHAPLLQRARRRPGAGRARGRRARVHGAAT